MPSALRPVTTASQPVAVRVSIAMNDAPRTTARRHPRNVLGRWRRVLRTRDDWQYATSDGSSCQRFDRAELAHSSLIGLTNRVQFGLSEREHAGALPRRENAQMQR